MAMLSAGRDEELLGDDLPLSIDAADRSAIIGAVHFYRDDLVTAVGELSASVVARGRDRTNHLFPMAMALRAEAELGLGRLEMAATHAELAASFATDTGSLHALIAAMSVQVEAAVLTDDLAEARSILARVDELADLAPAWSARSRVEVARATLAVADGDDEMLRDAAQRLSSGQLREPLTGFGSWRWLVVIAESRAADGRFSDARRSVEELAQQLAAHAGHRGWRDVERLRAVLSDQSITRVNTETPDSMNRTTDLLERLGLTARQRSVVALVAEGMTNKEIAAELFVSVKTIEYHLGQVYTRHGLHSRRDLVRLLRSG